MSERELAAGAVAPVPASKGIPAIDALRGTIKNRADSNRLQAIETRLADRALASTAQTLRGSVTGVILYNQALKQAKSGTACAALKPAGMVTGIKVDMGSKPLTSESGQPAYVRAAQKPLSHRARFDSAAGLGCYNHGMENQTLAA
jgi:fructose-bisphosphate aldolase class 1